MKKFLMSVLTIAAVLLFTNCSHGSSGTAMLDLDVRICPDQYNKDWYDKSKAEEKQKYDDLSNLFTVLPGPYEFIWEELKNADGSMGYEQCDTKLKIKLRLNKTLKPGPNINRIVGVLEHPQMTEEDMMEALKRQYDFKMFNSEGKTSLEDEDNIMLFLNPSLKTIWGVDGKIKSKDNKDGILDFYHFLTSEPGTEFDLVLDCGIHRCDEIEDIIEFNKGLYIHIGMRDIKCYNLE